MGWAWRRSGKHKLHGRPERVCGLSGIYISTGSFNMLADGSVIITILPRVWTLEN